MKTQNARVAILLITMILTCCESKQETQLQDAQASSTSDVVSAESSRTDTTKNTPNTPKALSGTAYLEFMGDAWYEIEDDSGRKISALPDSIPEENRIPNAGMTSETFGPDDLPNVYAAYINIPSSGIYRIRIFGESGTKVTLIATCKSPVLKERKKGDYDGSDH